MHWNHRVLKRIEQGKPVYGIVEAFYDDDGEVEACSAAFEVPTGESLEELAQDLAWMLAAVKAPVLDEAELDDHFERRRLAGKGLDAMSEQTVPLDSIFSEMPDEA